MYFFKPVTEMKPRAPCMLGKCSNTQTVPSPTSLSCKPVVLSLLSVVTLNTVPHGVVTLTTILLFLAIS